MKQSSPLPPLPYTLRSRDQHLAADSQPKRILSLDGGGLKGILTLGFLQKIESILRERHGNHPDFRLCHYFDLITGTSTGAIIAAALALGWRVDEILDSYNQMGKDIFQKTWLRKGFIRAKYDADKLSSHLKDAFGEDVTLGSDALKTGLLVITKRLDSGSPWPLSNNPNGKYFASHDNVIGNSEYPLWKVIRASTAAPHFFDPEHIDIIGGENPVQGEFVDGAMSPFNNPALQAVMYASLKGYRLNWPLAEDKLLLVSIGTGIPSVDPAVAKQNRPTLQHAIDSLKSLMQDCSNQQETLLQWMSSSPQARKIDSEIGNLAQDMMGGHALLQYLRYDVEFTVQSITALSATRAKVDAKTIEALSAIDSPDNMPLLYKLGKYAAEKDVHDVNFHAQFDLS